MKVELDNHASKSKHSVSIISLVLTVSICLWPLLVWVMQVNNGLGGIGNLRSAFGFSFSLVPLLCGLSFLVAAVGRKCPKVSTIALGVLVGSLISYSFLYVFTSKVNWQESHVRVNARPVLGLFK